MFAEHKVMLPKVISATTSITHDGLHFGPSMSEESTLIGSDSPVSYVTNCHSILLFIILAEVSVLQMG